MTGTEFRTQHGDPATWTTTDIESQQNLAEIDAATESWTTKTATEMEEGS